ncbi:MAG: hypothetical protein K2P94_01825, partial [Rhodospirillaceae bacterium]|nr:hypothetical protein [Rhodospirillaceae bacterium]
GESTTEIVAPAFVRVLDAVALAVLNADLTTAHAAAQAAERESTRLTRLAAQDASVSRQAAESAAAQAAGVLAREQAIAQRLAVEWAPGLASMKAHQRAALIDDIVAGKAALLRADAPGLIISGDERLTIILDGDLMVRAETLGRSGAVDSRMQTLGLLAVVRGSEARQLASGRVLDGRLSADARRSGMILPRSAIIRTDGHNWVYIKTSAESFERREIANATRTGEGWFVINGFLPKDLVVTKGAGSVFAVERATISVRAN